MDDHAAHLGFARKVIKASEFLHLAYLKGEPTNHGALHIYLEGDGSPWIYHRWVAPDPTPRNPVMLRLMRLDPAPSVFLGRPCYHGFSGTPPCSPLLWTHQRYSERVVKSMTVALEALIEPGSDQKIVLIGYSGGGTLAMLLAERMRYIHAVVTIAANLDVAAWTRHHGYTPLIGSLDPAQRPPLNSDIAQLHLAGARDRNIPPHLVRAVVARQHRAQFLVLKDYDHRCCWEEIWPSILGRIDGRMASWNQPRTPSRPGEAND